jgi:hypothetical protein
MVGWMKDEMQGTKLKRVEFRIAGLPETRDGHILEGHLCETAAYHTR